MAATELVAWDKQLIHTLYHDEPAFHYAFNAFCLLNIALRYPVGPEATIFYFQSLGQAIKELRMPGVARRETGFVHAAVLLALTETQRTGDAATCDTHIDLVSKMVEQWQRKWEGQSLDWDPSQGQRLSLLRKRLTMLQRDNLVLQGTDRARDETQARTVWCSSVDQTTLTAPVQRKDGKQTALSLKRVIMPLMVLAQARVGNALWPECKKRMQATRQGLEAWRDAFQHVLASGDRTRLGRAKAAFLRAHVKSALLIADVYDMASEGVCLKHEPEFESILVDLETALADGSWRLDEWYRILGVIPVAAFVALRCRTRPLRQRATALLRTIEIIENGLSSMAAAVLADMVAQTEGEAAFVRVVEAHCHFDGARMRATVELRYADTRQTPPAARTQQRHVAEAREVEALRLGRWPLDSVLRTYGQMEIKVMPCAFLTSTR